MITKIIMIIAIILFLGMVGDNEKFDRRTYCYGFIACIVAVAAIEDHEALLDILLKHKGYVVISGYETELYNSMLAGWNKYEMISYSQTCSKKREILWMNYEPSGKQMTFEDLGGLR